MAPAAPADPDDAAAILGEMGPDDAAAILAEMDPDDAAAILGAMDPDDAAAILRELYPNEPPTEPPSVEPPAPPAPPTEPPTEPETPVSPPEVNDNQGEKVFEAAGLVLFLEAREGEFFAYGIGYMFTPLNGEGAPLVEFPIFVSNVSQEEPRILATIPDPELEEVGDAWESALIEDPDYPNYVLKVEIVRREEKHTYRGNHTYRVRSYFSTNGGKSWWDPNPMDYPFELTLEEETTSLPEEGS